MSVILSTVELDNSRISSPHKKKKYLQASVKIYSSLSMHIAYGTLLPNDYSSIIIHYKLIKLKLQNIKPILISYVIIQTQT